MKETREGDKSKMCFYKNLSKRVESWINGFVI